MTIEELQQQFPPEAKEWVKKYGPPLLKMGREQLVDLIEMVAKGDAFDAHQQVLAQMESEDVLDEWTQIEAEWAAANEMNAMRLETQRLAFDAIMRVILKIALAAVGFPSL